MTSVAYLVLAHRAPAQVARLTERVCGAEDQLFLHVDRRVDIVPFSGALAEPIAQGRLRLARRRVASRWGSFALLDATLSLIEQALEESRASHLCLISGDSYPLVPVSTLHAFLDRAGDRSFLFHDAGAQAERPDRSANARWFWDGDLRRVTYRHYQLGDRQIHLPNRYVPFVPRLAPPADMELLQGSQWWTLTRAAARFVVEQFIRRPELRRYFRRVQAPDEWAVQMTLANSPLGDRIVNDDLHFICWKDWHAATLSASDLPRLASAAKLFARKLDPDDHALADGIDALIARRSADHTVLDRLTEQLVPG